MKANISVLVLTATLITAMMSGCVTIPYKPYARDVKKKAQQGGVVALKVEHRDEDRAKAQEMMARTCTPYPVKVQEEGEVVVGQETKTKGNTSYNQGAEGEKVGSLFGMPLVSGQKDPSQSVESASSTVQLKEWQIMYECEKNTRKASR
ncbi:hypothetical protein D3C87_144770 [compost metagenome]